MENSPDDEQQIKIASFVEIVGESAAKARQFLQATNWQLEEAIQLFYVDNEGRGATSSSLSAPLERDMLSSKARQAEISDDYVRPPLPVKREALYEDAYHYRAQWTGRGNQSNVIDAFRNFEEEARYRSSWGSDSHGSPSGETIKDNLAALYRPPFALMFQGGFEQAKVEASRQGRWLLVNIQSTKEFSSHMLNRDTWANEAVKETISSTFIFWQVYDDAEEGRKVCTYYHLFKMPAILVLDPVTGQKMRAWNGMVDPERLLEDLINYMDKGPLDRHPAHPHKRQREVNERPLEDNSGKQDIDDELQQALAASLEGLQQPPAKESGGNMSNFVSPNDQSNGLQSTDVLPKVKQEYPPLPAEPDGDKAQICRVGIRLPDGRRVQRKFLRTDSIKLLWSFCCSEIKEAAEGREFKLVHSIPGALKTLDFDCNINIADSGLCNSVISMAWV
eukprot:TRINITY_DN699_c0_g1_i1.p1 TRINITY_DN699_c0_g1~~TRINITY_DN699_c0_g1_i1.p1  ORF type:complete len:448 (-),score=105.14 TRINITY_DN699_c0_g1_i1:369-1712(-)